MFMMQLKISKFVRELVYYYLKNVENVYIENIPPNNKENFFSRYRRIQIFQKSQKNNPWKVKPSEDKNGQKDGKEHSPVVRRVEYYNHMFKLGPI